MLINTVVRKCSYNGTVTIMHGGALAVQNLAIARILEEVGDRLEF